MKHTLFGSAAVLTLSGLVNTTVHADEQEEASETTYLTLNTEPLLQVPDEFP